MLRMDLVVHHPRRTHQRILHLPMWYSVMSLEYWTKADIQRITLAASRHLTPRSTFPTVLLTYTGGIDKCFELIIVY
jgi:hypothetical protein